MIVRFEGSDSQPKNLVGGCPQGTLIAGVAYNVSSDDCPPETRETKETNEENQDQSSSDKFRYYDDLNVLELIILTDKLIEYDFKTHVASDIGINHLYLPPEQFKTQSYLNEISQWTDLNLMKLNEAKSNYIIFSRSKVQFDTRLKLNSENLERVSVTRVLGVWLQEDMKWEENTKQICIKAYSRVSILCKLKYVGIKTEDLLTIYILFIRSVTEYCSVVFHSSLTEAQTNKLEAIQKTCLRVILAENYVSYEVALEMCGLQRLETRRESRQLSFALRCLKNEFNTDMFPKNDSKLKKETFKVNFAKTEAYRKSSVIQCQHALNKHFNKKPKA